MLTPTKPRICIVNPFEHGGGAEYQISLLIDALVGAGRFEIHYLTHFIDGRKRSRPYQLTRIGGGGAIPRFGYLQEAGSLYRALSHIRPTIIYQRVACAYTGICAFYSRRRGIPLVWHVAHDTEVTPQILDSARNLVRLRMEKWAVESGARNATRIVVQTHHQAELLENYYSRKAAAVIPNFHPPATEAIDKSGPLTVVWIANLKPWKQPEVFVRLAYRLSSRKDLRFVMVGAAGPDNSWQRELMRSIDASQNLEYWGEKTLGEVNTLLARSHVFVNTSRHEGFPNTFIQAWLRDAAVVSLTVDPDQVLERQQVGIRGRSEDGLTSAVTRLLDNPSLLAQYAGRGREHAHAHHSLQNVRQLIGLLESTSSDAAAVSPDSKS